MKRSRIDGKGLLPYICRHGQGYNGASDGRVCVKCAEERAEELETIIAKLANGIMESFDYANYLPMKENLNRVLARARTSFDNRPDLPADMAHERDLGKWL